ncbi:MAG: ABC transporter permease [Balneolaceae bacterium]|nr:ABC transporter permease [Balneolaceae bacterium]MBO6544774.1 ABC transporter permease [Balneolaceae bacterium]MBO6646170.1 ABC transporter permease [Balneolaceae bacterium]
MFKNYLKIAYRNIVKDKYYSLISFVGLSIGLSFFALMLIFLNHELNYDTSYSDHDRIYRTLLTSSQDDLENTTAQLPLPFSDVITSELEGIESVSKVYGVPQQILETEVIRGRLDDIVATDGAFFDIFDLEIVAGNSENPLENQMSIVLTETTAQRFFGESNPIGKTIEVEAYGLFTVTAVLDEIPNNSSFRFTAIMNASVDRYLENFTGPDWFRTYYTSWNGRVAHNYIKLDEEADPELIASQLQEISANYFGNPEINRRFTLQPIIDVHFNSSAIQTNIDEVNGVPGNIQYVYIFIAIAVLILVIACINYMNLSSARSIKRTAEVGLRSVFGAQKSQLVLLFLVQSVLMATMALIPSLGLLQLMIPYFESIAGIQLALSNSDLINVGLSALPLLLIIGIVSGSYPAFMLTKNELSNTVKQTSTGSVQSSFFRKSLVVGQFALTYIIVVLTLVTSKQLGYIFDKELGFENEQVVVMEINDGRLRNSIPDLKQQISSHPNVIGIAGLSRMISGYREPDIVEVSREENPEENLPLSFYGFDEHVLPLLELDILQGRNFHSEGGENINRSSVLINRAAAQMLFKDQSPINQTLSLGNEEPLEATVVGVIEDFHYRSLHEEIEPLIIGYIDNPFVGIDDFAIRLSGNETSETLADIEQIVGQFIELDEEAGLEYEFLDSMIADYYKIDVIYKKLFTIGSWVTIILAIVGLVGLTSFYAEMRTKEFGIRKVLGASLKDLVSIQSAFFVKLIFIAIFLGIPLSYFIILEWLQNFSYQVDFGIVQFAIASTGIFAIALLPICIIAVRTALQNPISQLRTE